MTNHNHGIQNFGPGQMHITGSAIGTGAQVHYSPPSTSAQATKRCDIGVLTVVAAEASAISALAAGSTDRHEARHDDRTFHEFTIGYPGGSARLVTLQQSDRGQQSTVAAYQAMRQRYRPRLVVIVGIAGGIHPDLGIGDVAVANQIIHYDSRREEPGDTRRRANVNKVPHWVQNAINDFFADHGEPARFSPPGSAGYIARPGPIGSGESVIRDASSAIRQYLHTVNDKTLAVETEGAALAQASYEDEQHLDGPKGWMVIRGISDHADPAKDDSRHELAARNAAQTLRELLPTLMKGLDETAGHQ
ncbi:5'-methylthioadenosine/S-adenosylhomocysteine nucleosidase [Catellatospora chokoriensis]|uniref:Nucleoside phosphorylase domain-containing protein n=1 Tax=Catellatospora chokoriensis TaxID=310353 RepID=A0A8J3K317_9ACTN|nr:5'-methylthioadenosine/S-adenosylhomocysteine nucleosidase [Catellatospora chokoriensis]GIF91522.1 hypothetical protein Cch02nite_49660 [Catellatospora chokoriensis]